eukprot:31074-Pelagococcus_subviridis.AAC.24
MSVSVTTPRGRLRLAHVHPMHAVLDDLVENLLERVRRSRDDEQRPGPAEPALGHLREERVILGRGDGVREPGVTRAVEERQKFRGGQAEHPEVLRLNAPQVRRAQVRDELVVVVHDADPGDGLLAHLRERLDRGRRRLHRDQAEGLFFAQPERLDRRLSDPAERVHLAREVPDDVGHAHDAHDLATLVEDGDPVRHAVRRRVLPQESVPNSLEQRAVPRARLVHELRVVAEDLNERLRRDPLLDRL